MSETEYKLHEELGQGQTGKVFRATEPGGRAVAVKRFHTQLCRPGQALDELLRTHRSVAALRQPGLLAPLASWTEPDGSLALAMELAPGGSLGERLERQGPMPIREAVELLTRIGSALSTAHLAGVVHGDVKPSNVLLGADGAPLLSDFGHAGLVLQDEISRELADEDYLAPELLAGGRPDPRSDVHGLAATLYCMLTGQSPRQGAAWRVAPQLRTVVNKALARDPAARPASVEAFVAELQRAARPRKGPALVLAMAGCALLAGVAAAVWLMARSDSPEPIAVAEPTPAPAADAGLPDQGRGLPPGVEQGRGRPGAPVEPGQNTPAEAPSVAEREGPRTCAALLEDLSVERTLTKNGWAYGFVKNPCDYPVDKPRVDLAFYDAGDRLVARAHGYAAHDLLLPGERSPVTVLLKPYPQGWARQEAQVTAHEPFAAYRRRASLEVLDTRVEPQRLGSSLVVRVRVRNTDAQPVEHVQVTVGLYDGVGKLRAMHLGFIEPAPLGAGQQGEARVYLLPPEKIEPYRLEAWADGVIYTKK